MVCRRNDLFRSVFRTLSTSKMKLFAKVVNDWKPLNSFANNTILDIWHGSEYASAISAPRERDSSCLNVDPCFLMALFERI